MCPGHVLPCPGMSWACPGHVQVMSEAPSNSLLMHFFRYRAFPCTDSFSIDRITVKFIGCGVTVFSANTPVFLSNSRQILTFQKPLLLHMCPVMSWEHNGSIFDAALVGK